MSPMKQLRGELIDVRIRPYGIGDADLLRGMSARLTSQSLYLRFFSGTPKIPETYVRSLERLDHWDHDALAALLDGEMLGVAEYVRYRHDPATAELAVLITDEWQRRGLGTCLVVLLAELAARRGIAAFNADVSLENAASHSLVRRFAPAAIPHYAEGAIHYRMSIPA